MSETRKKGVLIYIFLLIFIILDSVYSFYQHYHMPIGGDIAQVVMPTPSKGYYKVLQHPLGIKAIVNKEQYPNPNRFFAHRTSQVYLKNMPLLLQKIVSPISSIYLSNAIAKMLIQILLLVVLAVCISGFKKYYSFEFILALALIIPLFQTSGYNRYMGIIDQSIIYTFFYAAPLSVLFFFFTFFYKELYYNRQIKNVFLKIVLIILTVYLALNGPLIPGVVLIVCPLVLIRIWWQKYSTIKDKLFIERFKLSVISMPKFTTYTFVLFCLFSLYSLYLGKYNSMNSSSPLIERYLNLPLGVYYLLTSKLAFPILLGVIAFNLVIIKKYFYQNEGQKILKMAKWIGVFALLYILLLPLGGYRDYRQYILRYDTFIPVTLSFIFIFGKTTFYLINNYQNRSLIIYSIVIILVLAIYTNSDRLNTKSHYCEKAALEIIASSEEDTIKLKSDCFIMEFNYIHDRELARLKSKLLEHWNIIDREKVFYQE